LKALIKVGYGCNENCTFCHTLDVRHVNGSSAEVHAKIDRARALGHTMVVLSGGEATIRPELVEWAAHIAAAGMDFGLVTNGLIFAYPDAVEKLFKHRLKYVYMSLHGGSAPVHDRLVRAHTFEQARAALANLAGRGLDFTINCVITNQNVDALRGVVDLLLAYPDVRLKFSMVQPKGGGDRAFQALMPRVTDVAARVRDAIAYGQAQVAARGAAGPAFAHDGVPLCLLPEYAALYDDLKTHAFATMVEIGEPDFFPVDDKDKIQTDACRGCALRGPCPGLYRGYEAVFGDGELRPLAAGPRSNSFHWIFEALVPAPPAAASGECPLAADGPTPWDRGRHLFVRNGDRIGRFRASTRDFADVEIERIKHGLGQVYLDASRKDAPDDFARDLVPLERAAVCAPCTWRDRCTGLYEPRYEDVFTRDDARVRAILAALDGDVLDVGCGDGPYDDVLAPLAFAGRIRYVGIDPDGARLEALRARRPWAAALRALAAEALDDDARYDHALVLRSWNHLADARGVAARLVRAVRPGGTVTVVDNVAFGLARTAAQAARAERSPARFEHYRNDDAADAIAAFTSTSASASAPTSDVAPPVELVERHDIGPGSSNQWLVRFRRL
jgi:MoaA/NifB/PqqE/SkfB family radical SAM enzyme/SAM-dependent methyltransferase